MNETEAPPKNSITIVCKKLYSFLQRLWYDRIHMISALWIFTIAFVVFMLSSIVFLEIEKSNDSSALSKSNITDIKALATKLSQHHDPVSLYIWEILSLEMKHKLEAYSQDVNVNLEIKSASSQDVKTALVKEFNRILRGNCIYDAQRFAGVTLSKETHRLIGEEVQKEEDLIRLNRLLLEDCYPQQISKNQIEGDQERINTSADNSHTATPNEPQKILRVTTADHYLYLKIAALVGIGAFLGMVVLLLRGYPTRKACDGIFTILCDKQTRHDCVAALVLAVVTTTLCLIVLLVWIDHPTWLTWTKTILLNTGGLFALITGIGTLVGTYIAIHSVLEMKHTITSFPQLLERLSFLINEDHDPEIGVAFLAYTPLTGWFNVLPKLREKFRDAIIRADKKVKVVCLDSEDHTDWLDLFEGKYAVGIGQLDHNTIRKFNEDCETVLKVLAGHRCKGHRGKELPSKIENFRFLPIRLKSVQMPGYYFFVSSERAIVVAPAEMPRLNNQMPDATENTQKLANRVHVETLGFETTDQQIIQLLQVEFNRYTSNLFIEYDIQNPKEFVSWLYDRGNPDSKVLWSKLSTDTQQKLTEFHNGNGNEKEVRSILMKALNKILQTDWLDSSSANASIDSDSLIEHNRKFIQKICARGLLKRQFMDPPQSPAIQLKSAES